MLTRRDLIKLLLAAPIAATVDVEQLLWVPKPIVVVPTMPFKPYLDVMLTNISVAYIRSTPFGSAHELYEAMPISRSSTITGRWPVGA